MPAHLSPRSGRHRTVRIAPHAESARALAWTVRARCPPARSRLRARRARRGRACSRSSRPSPTTACSSPASRSPASPRPSPTATAIWSPASTREAFEVYEDGERQTITQFTRERVPVGLGVLLDISDSMFGKRIEDARAAVERFLFELLDPADEFFLMAFNHQPRAADRLDARAAATCGARSTALRPSGGTAIYDAILEALPLHRAGARGSAPRSWSSPTAPTRPAPRRCASCGRRCCAATRSSTRSRSTRPSASRSTRASTPQALREITAESGGRTEIVQNSAQLDEATARIAEELNSQYVLGYTLAARRRRPVPQHPRADRRRRTTASAPATATSRRRRGKRSDH